MKNPKGPKKGVCRVVRGASYGYDTYDLRSTNRGRYKPICLGSILGFRLVRIKKK